MRVTSLLLLLLFFINLPAFSQTTNKFQKKISGYLSKDEVEKAENFCAKLKSINERAECYSFMGDKALEELDYSKAIRYFLKAKNTKKQHFTLLEAVKNNEQQTIDNYLVRAAKEEYENAENTVINNKAFMPIADLCYRQKDYKNAGYYYEKANVKQLSTECKVLHAINTKDYITVVELSEKETIGLRNTMEVYKHAADQYFAKGNYAAAGKCYKKVGNKAKVKLCFRKERETELTKALSVIKANKFNFSDNPFEIEKKLIKIGNQVSAFEKTGSIYKQNDYTIESDSWMNFSERIKNIIDASKSGIYLVKSKDKNIRDGKMLLEEAWKHITKIALENKVNLTIQEQEPVKTILKEISQLEANYNSQVQKMASKQLSESGINSAKTVYHFPKAIVEAKKLIDDYFLSINAKETPKATAWMIYGIVRHMHDKIMNKLGKFESSAKSESTKVKVEEQKVAQIGYCAEKLKASTYLSTNFIPKTWNDFLFQKSFREMSTQLSVVKSN